MHTWFPLGLERLEQKGTVFHKGKSQGVIIGLEKSGNFAQDTERRIRQILHWKMEKKIRSKKLEL